MRKPRVIIIDDDESVRKLLSRFMSKRNYEVVSLQDPTFCPLYRSHESGCEKHAACADVMLTDHKMPNMTGIELLKRQQRNNCKLPINNKAVLSGMLNRAENDTVLFLGATVINKPYTLKQIEQWLDEREKEFDLSIDLDPIEPEK